MLKPVRIGLTTFIFDPRYADDETHADMLQEAQKFASSKKEARTIYVAACREMGMMPKPQNNREKKILRKKVYLKEIERRYVLLNSEYNFLQTRYSKLLKMYNELRKHS